jgi:tetratricopeptide (TPR) repeat protein
MKVTLPGAAIAAVSTLILLMILLMIGRTGPPGPRAGTSRNAAGGVTDQRPDVMNAPLRSERWVRTPWSTQPEPPEQIVWGKVSKFGQSRRELALRLAEKQGVAMTPEIDAFFRAVEAGDWEQILATFSRINGGDSSAGPAGRRSPEANKMWPAIIDAFGAAEQAHLWPPEALLDYGYSILETLRPGMVYVGGTDSSRWVPALLNDTEEGDPHIVITQNGLADSAYLEYVALQFGGRMNTVTREEFDSIFADYKKDARARLEHDEQFPGEPRQVRRGEILEIAEGDLKVTGRTAVFDMNERLLNKLLEKNPDLSFAVGESIPLKGTYAHAAPLGPLMELRANPGESFTSDRANDSVEYWRNTAERILADPVASASESAVRSYSHDAVAAGNLLAAQNFHAQAEEAYSSARNLWPGNPETTAGLFELYRKTGRQEEAQRLLQRFVAEHPGQRQPLKDHWGLELE